MSDSTHTSGAAPFDNAADAATDYRALAKNAGVNLDFVKRHLFRDSAKAMIFEDFDHARSTVKGKREALVVVDNSLKGALALDRATIEKVFPALVEAFDTLTSMSREKEQTFDVDRDLIVLFAQEPLPHYHGKDVRGFWVWRVAGTCHFRQFPSPDDSKAEKRAFGSQGD